MAYIDAHVHVWTPDLNHYPLAAGYKAEVVWIDCDPEVGMRRNLARGDLDISSAFCQDFHRRWLLAAARPAMQQQ